MREILFRGKAQKDNKWYIGYYGKTMRNNIDIVYIDTIPEIKSWGSTQEHIIVIPETIGQLRYENKHGKYFDGDIYYCSGCGLDVVSEFCEITDRLMHGDTDDIGEIIGNIYDNPEIRK